MKIAIQGIEGSFHHEAANELFPDQEIELIKCSSFDAVTQALEKEKAQFGVMAVENTIAGSILPNYNLIDPDTFEILDEVYLNIQMYLMALETESIIDIFEVHSHPVALLQCRDYLRKFPPQFKIIEGADTASAAKRIKENNLRGVAAIAGKRVAERFDLKVLDSQIQDIKDNETRFLLVARRGANLNRKTPDKATVKFQLSHESGSLSRALKVFADQDISLTKIQSLPVLDNPWRYAFYVDLTFGDPGQFQRALEELAPFVQDFKVVGTYTQNRANVPSELSKTGNNGQ